jgi:hypothetical protein
MSAEILSGAAGILLSLLFSYTPGLRQWYGKQSGEAKSLIMLASLVVVACGVFGLSCYGPFDWVQCTQDGAWGLGILFVSALVTNQPMYNITRKIGGSA